MVFSLTNALEESTVISSGTPSSSTGLTTAPAGSVIYTNAISCTWPAIAGSGNNSSEYDSIPSALASNPRPPTGGIPGVDTATSYVPVSPATWKNPACVTTSGSAPNAVSATCSAPSDVMVSGLPTPSDPATTGHGTTCIHDPSSSSMLPSPTTL